jgi:hypothetical protein
MASALIYVVDLVPDRLEILPSHPYNPARFPLQIIIDRYRGSRRVGRGLVFGLTFGMALGLVEALRDTEAHFRNEIAGGRGGKQILLEDPSGNPIELFEPPGS